MEGERVVFQERKTADDKLYCMQLMLFIAQQTCVCLVETCLNWSPMGTLVVFIIHALTDGWLHSCHVLIVFGPCRNVVETGRVRQVAAVQ